jgi:hypothetical protein
VFVAGASQLGFSDAQGLGTHVQFDPNSAPQIAAVPNRGNDSEVFLENFSTSSPISQVTVPDSTTLDPTRQLTLETWIEPFSPGNGGYVPLVTKIDGSTYSYSLWMGQDGSLLFFASGDKTFDYLIAPAGTIKTFQSYNVAAVVDRDSGQMSLYVICLHTAQPARRTSLRRPYLCCSAASRA